MGLNFRIYETEYQQNKYIFSSLGPQILWIRYLPSRSHKVWKRGVAIISGVYMYRYVTWLHLYEQKSQEIVIITEPGKPFSWLTAYIKSNEFNLEMSDCTTLDKG